MWRYPESFDVIVIGGGHAGCEAAHAAAASGCKTLLLTQNLDTIAKMSCNPAIGGVGKGHVVREIDALGGLMGKVTDGSAIQRRMLNSSKGPAVWSPRAQADKAFYAQLMRSYLEQVDRLHLKQGSVQKICAEQGKISGVLTNEAIFYSASAVILASGTFMRGLCHIGNVNFAGGRAGCPPTSELSASLEALGLRLGRLKTGTPARIHSRSIDYSLTEEQPGEEGVFFSYDQPRQPSLAQVSCHIAYTTPETQQIIRDNFHLSLMYREGRDPSIVGPRYCPSIEDKVVRFADKERHQLFLEPEGLHTEEVYINGVSTSLPVEVQYAFLRSIPALKNAEILRPGYAIEYDYVLPGQIDATLQTRCVEGLYLAGQINGTTGYEEAAAQGLMAAINASKALKKEKPLILKRSEAYIGVLIDDLITKEGRNEPYRVFTSRAEFRLLLRQDNADLRLRHYGYEAGLIDEERYGLLVSKKNQIQQQINRLQKSYKQVNGKGISLLQFLARPEMTYRQLSLDDPEAYPSLGDDIEQQIELYAKYEGYLQRQFDEVERMSDLEESHIPLCFDYFGIKGLRKEAQERLSLAQPHTLGQALRLSGVSPADISVLRVALKNRSSAAAPIG